LGPAAHLAGAARQNYASSHEAILDLAGTAVKFDISRPGEFKRMVEAQRAVRKPTV
jgi:hypothetical protein